MQDSQLKELEQKLHHSIQIPGATPERNLRESSLDLLRRAMSLDEAVRTLNLNYTYEIIEAPREKREARKQLGKMVAPLLEGMRDQLVKAAFIHWSNADDLVKGVEEVGETVQESAAETPSTDGEGREAP